MYKLRISSEDCFVVLDYRLLGDVTDVLYKLFNSTTAFEVEIWYEEREDTCLNSMK